jgi:tRNA(Met) cytidine acetyltransferase
MDVAARLREEARATDERRLLVLAGDPATTRERAGSALDAAAIDRAATTYLGPAEPLDCECLETTQSDALLGVTRAALVVDCHERCEPDTLGRVAGVVDGGGLLLLLVPPLDEWPDRHDAFDDSLAVPPFEAADVTGHFRRRLVETLRTHRGVAIVDVDTGTVERDGRCERAPRPPAGPVTPPEDHAFPAAAYDACRTQDQSDALAAFEALREDGAAVVVEADRGRGKSSVAGLAAGSLALAGADVLVTAPGYRSARELFARASELLAGLDALAARDRADAPHRLATAGGEIRFCEPAELADRSGEFDRVFVDEAAALPVDRLRATLAADGAAFTTTVHGYEGAGRGFSVRFRAELADSTLSVADADLAEPIRYAAGDPVEVWSFRALALDAGPPVDPLVADATPETATYRALSSADLLDDENLLREVFGLLVLAHYRTEPNDLARLLDAPNVSVHALLFDGHPVSVALLAREGGLSADRRRALSEGGTVRGNLIPDLLASQLRDEDAAGPVGHRVLRIATHSAARSRGLGSLLLSRLREHCVDGHDAVGANEQSADPAVESDWLGVAFGATPRLVEFWRANGFQSVHLGTSRDARSGEHSAVMLDPLSAAGRQLCERHTDWFLRRLPGTLADALSAVDPDLVRAVCRATAGTPALDLTRFEWRVAAGIPHGAAFIETAPRPVRRLALRHLVDPAESTPGQTDGSLSAREERLLVCKALQCRSWAETSEVVGAESARTCKRALGGAVERLVELYGDETAREELERLR